MRHLYKANGIHYHDCPDCANLCNEQRTEQQNYMDAETIYHWLVGHRSLVVSSPDVELSVSLAFRAVHLQLLEQLSADSHVID